MQPALLLGIIVLYFLLLFAIAFIGRKNNSNQAFFLGNRRSPWYVVAFGMLGASLSGISFISVPGMVLQTGYTYMEMVVGFSLGYVVIAHLLLPVYYQLKVTCIYEYLGKRIGPTSYKTGSFYFLLSRALGGAARLYAAAIVLQAFVFDYWHIPFWATTLLIILAMYLYTHNNGIKTIVWTDALQTFFMLAALIWLLVEAFQYTGGHNPIADYNYFQWDWGAKNNFFKFFLSGIFITVSMTGLDQDMMQKNLSCKTLKESQKNLYSYGFAFIPINLIFLFLGASLVVLLTQNGIALPTQTDLLLPTAVQSGLLSEYAIILFMIGIVAATFSSADSTLVSVTTTFCLSFLPSCKTEEQAVRQRRYTHVGVCLFFVLIMLCFHYLNGSNIIDILFQMASYTYGPLLGLFAFGLFTKRQANDRLVPWIAGASPLICIGIQALMEGKMGYELLMLNGILTFVGLMLISKKQQSTPKMR